jgi:hypothetical protein
MHTLCDVSARSDSMKNLFEGFFAFCLILMFALIFAEANKKNQ